MNRVVLLFFVSNRYIHTGGKIFKLAGCEWIQVYIRIDIDRDSLTINHNAMNR